MPEEMVDILSRALAPQTFQNREQRIHGLLLAIVSGIGENGTYRLQIMGLNGQEGDDRSAPARVAAPMAGNGRGVHFFPEVGDEVVVGFEAGDPNHPIILGALWNGQDRPPDQAKESERNDIRTVVSRSGHELTFDDTPGAEKVTLKSKGGHTVTLDDAPTGPKVSVESAGGRSIVLDDTPPGSVSIRSLTGQITLGDTGAVKIEAPTIELDAAIISINSAVLTIGAGAGATTIDGVPFKLHTHTGVTTGPGISGPVA